MALPPAAAPQKPDPTAATPSPPAGGASPPAPQNNGAPPAGQQQAPAGGKAPAAKPAGGSIYEAVGELEPGQEGSASWPSDWRDQVASAIGDPAAIKALERYGSPVEMGKALIAAQQKIRTGEYKRAAPKGDSPEEVKAWREEQGIPESPDGYDLPAVPGVDMSTMDEGTKASLGIIKGALHSANLNKEQAGVVAQSLVQVAAAQAEAAAQADAQNRDAIEDTLRAEWGAEYRRNIDINGAFLTKHFGDGMDDLLNARTPTGMRLADSPEFNKFLNTMAREGGGDILFAGDPKGGASIDSRLDEIKQIMGRDMGEYLSKGLDKEYAKLLERKEARGGR